MAGELTYLLMSVPLTSCVYSLKTQHIKQWVAVCQETVGTLCWIYAWHELFGKLGTEV